MAALRVLVAWCPDWPVQAAGFPYEAPVAVLRAGRVVACSPAARAEGVTTGLRRREAQRRCTGLVLVPDDPDRDARAYEAVVAAVEAVAPRVEILRPGECAFPAGGAARFHGGEQELAAKVAVAVDRALGGQGRCRAGIADGVFAAGLAARHGMLVPAGETARFLAPFGVATLDRPDLADLLTRLGLHTLGQLAALPLADLAARFGPEGMRAHRLASGSDEYPRNPRRPPPDLRVAATLDPPAQRIDVAAFAAKALADQLSARLRRLGLACLALRIEVETEHGERLARVWRHQDGFASQARRGAPSRAAAMAERVRWQLDGWLAGAPASQPSGAISRLVLSAEEVAADRGRQLGFWGEESERRERAVRAMARVQGMLGAEAVRTVELRGGRAPGDRVAFTSQPGVAASGPARPPPPGNPPSTWGIPPSAGPASSPSGGSPPPAWGVSPGTAPVSSPSSGAPPHLRGASPGGSPAGPSPEGSPPPAWGVPPAAGPAGSPPPGGSLPSAWGVLPGTGPAGNPSPGGSPPPAWGVPSGGGGGRPRPAGQAWGEVAPWPGQVPAPAPAVVHPEPLAAEVADATGAVVAVGGRGLASAPPARLRVAGGPWTAITAWAGPWPVDERWWDPGLHRRLARLQVVTADGTAHLLKLSGGTWWVEATYD